MMRLLALSLLLGTWCAQARAQVALPEVMEVPTYPLGPRLSAREAALGAHLRTASADDRHRSLLGWLMISVGAAAGAIGAGLPHEVGPLLWPLAARSIAGGIASLSVSENAGPISARYASVPRFTADQVRARFELGERALERRAHQHRKLRITGAALFLFSAASYVPLRYGLARSRDPDYRFGDNIADYFLLGLSAVDAGVGILQLFERSPAEQAARSYRELVGEQEQEAPGELQRLSLRLAPRSRGASFSLAVRF